MSQRDEIIAVIENIPAMPAAAAGVLSLAQSQDSSMTDIMDAIQRDPGLASDVLRLANSSYFAGPRSVGSLREAGVLFGTDRILQMVLTSSVSPVARKRLRGYDLPPGQLMGHLVTTAIAAEQLAKALAIIVPDYLYTAGLLHDIGKIVLGTFVEADVEAIIALASGEATSFEKAERQILGIDHPEAGALLLQTWNFPEDIVQAVRWHHDPDQLDGDKCVADLVHIADLLSVECGFGLGVDELNYERSTDATERLKIKRSVVDKTVCALLDEFAKVSQYLPQEEGGP